MAIKLSREDAVAILHAHDGNFDKLKELDEWGTLSSTVKTYTAIYMTSTSERTIKILIILGSAHALNVLSSLHGTIVKNASPSNAIPLATLLKRDDTTKIVSSPYALYTHPAGAPFNTLYSPSSSSPGSPSTLQQDKTQTRIKAELRLGAALKILHEHVQNDWFGIPGEEKEWGECYSWQEAFTLLLENALSEIEERARERELRPRQSEAELGTDEDTKIPIPITDIHRLLSRAIGFYLFDDVEVPSVVFNPSLDWASRIFISAPSLPSESRQKDEDAEESTQTETNREEEEGEITAFLGLENALWGDPLLEGVFHPSYPSLPSSLPTPSGSSPTLLDTDIQPASDPGWPSKPLLEGYASNPMILPRHPTKRLWYDLFVALRELVKVLSGPDREGGEDGEIEEKEKDVRKRITGLVKKLEGAPCY